MSLYNNTLQFIFYPLSFITQDSLFYPPGKTAHILCGTPGVIFQKSACLSDRIAAEDCDGNPTKGRARA